MRFTFVTLFENLIAPYFEDSILKRAIEKSIISVDFKNPREFSKNKHKKVDDYLFGGGAGLLMTPQPLFDTLNEIKTEDSDVHIIFLTPVGKSFSQKDSIRLSQKKHLVFVSGRYEGIDERVLEEFADEVFSIGDYVLTGGELPSLVLADSISRNINGVLGNFDSLQNESFNSSLLEAPSFTRPSNYDGKEVPETLRGGNHKEAEVLKKKLSINKTKYFRPDKYLKIKKVLD